MEPGTSEWTTVMNRLERLEKQNRRMKQIGVLALLLVGLLVLTGQAAQKKTVEANELILRDTNGNVRVEISGDGSLVMYDSAGNTTVYLASVPNLLGIHIPNRKPRTGLSGGGQLALSSATKGTTGGVYIDSESLHVGDEDGFETTIGATDLVTARTGETHTTSAASVVLFDKNKKVLWKAP